MDGRKLVDNCAVNKAYVTQDHNKLRQSDKSVYKSNDKYEQTHTKNDNRSQDSFGRYDNHDKRRSSLGNAIEEKEKLVLSRTGSKTQKNVRKGSGKAVSNNNLNKNEMPNDTPPSKQLSPKQSTRGMSASKNSTELDFELNEAQQLIDNLKNFFLNSPFREIDTLTK